MNMYIGNLSYKISAEELQQCFEQYGTVTSSKIIKDRESGKSKGFGFVEMPNDDEANEAMEKLNGYELNGRKIIVNSAKRKEA